MPELPRGSKALPWNPERKQQTGRRYRDKRYQGRRWQRLRLVVLNASPMCAHCHEAPAQVVDHITPVRLAPDRFYDLTNLQPLCHRCHNVKSATTDKQHPTT